MDWKMVNRVEKTKHLWLWCAVVGFLGYAIGRIGSILWGYLNVPHHWIYGMALMVVAPFLRKHWWWVLVFSFGIGMFVSDLNDFLQFKIWGVDTVEEQKFWGFD